MAIISSIILYIVWMVLPAGIAISIFKLFPDTKVTASGPFQNLTVNVTGAFAAFFITLLTGWFLIDRIDSRIHETLVSPTWEVIAKVRFLDAEGKEIRIDEALRKDLTVFIAPPIAETADLPAVYVRLPLVKPGEWRSLHFNIPGFETGILNPRQLIAEKKAIVDNLSQKIDLGELVLHQARKPKSPPQSVAKKYAESYQGQGGVPPPPFHGKPTVDEEKP